MSRPPKESAQKESSIAQTPPRSDNPDYNILMDPRYNRTVAPLIMEALEKRRDLVQLPNGDIIITEQKTISIRYEFNGEKGKMMRATTGRSKRSRSKQSDEDFDFDVDSEFEFDSEKEDVAA